MLTQTHIYKSSERGGCRSELFSRLSVFNFDQYRNEAALPFGTIEAFNEETLCPGNTVVTYVEQFMDVVIIPLSGSVVYKDSLGNRTIVEAEQAGIFSVQEGMVYELLNIYEKSHVNYLQIWLKADEKQFVRQSRHKDFSDQELNELFLVFAGRKSEMNVLKTNSDSTGSIGIYNTGNGGRYVLKSKNHGLFAFVINGTFELDGNLLQQRDSISLSGISGMDFKAVSENSAILLIEIPC